MYELIGVGISFLVLGILISKKIEFGIALLAATGILLITNEPTMRSLVWMSEILSERETINLVLVILLIGLIGYIYRDSGQVRRIILELQNALPDRRMVIASIPAIFGLLPMPGGALVSAPMIDQEGTDLGIDGVHKAFLNWWFRHAWFSIYPLDMGLIFAASIAGVSIYHIALFNLPIFVIHVMAGITFGLRGIEVESVEQNGRVNIFFLIYDFLPIISALMLNILLGIPLYICLMLAVIILLLQNHSHYTRKKIPSLMKDGLSTKLFMAALGIMLFKGTIERTEALIPVVDILEGQVPLVFVVLLGGFLVGLMIGHLPAAVGISFPILVPMIPNMNFQIAAAMFLFVFLGYLISPIHLCIVLTLEYYKADMKRFYIRAAGAILSLIATVILWLLFTGTFFLF